MKMTPKPQKQSRRHQITTLALNLGLLAGLAALPLQAQDDENIPAGYTEDEWFDPGDWFDNDNIEPAGSDWWDNLGWSNSDANDSNYDYDYDSNYGTGYRTGFGTGYSYDPNVFENDWTTDTDNQARTRPDRRDGNEKANRNQARSMKRVSFNGEVEGFKKVNLRDREGRRDQHTFVRVRLNDGGARVVSLGNRLILSDLNLEKGAQISVSGRNARIDNRDVLVASSIEVDDQPFRISKNNRLETDQRVSIDGTVKESSKTSLSNDSREKNLLILLELKNGRSCVVDLGRDTNLSDLDIEKGSEIRLQGRKTKVNGKSLIIASMITLNGESTRLRDRSQANESPRRDREESWQNSEHDTRPVSLESVSSN